MREILFIALCVCFVYAHVCTNSAIRAADGTCNNLQNPLWGSSGQFFRQVEGYLPPNSIPRPNERTVSNKVLAVPDWKLDINYTAIERKYGNAPDGFDRNAFFVAFSQFVAHDIGQNPLLFNFQNISANYQVQMEDPTDPLYQPTINAKTGILTIVSQGVKSGTVFQPFNNATSYLDLSTVYGSNVVVATALRSLVGGKLQVDQVQANYLPFAVTTPGVPNECGNFRPGPSAAGDLRVDENPHLTAIHTIFTREHNRIADKIAQTNPSFNDEEIYQAARTRLIAVYQHIVFDEFLPQLFGPKPFDRIGKYRYDNDINPTAWASFSTAANRLIHDLVPLPQLYLFQNCSFIQPPSTEGVPLQEGSNCIPFFFREIGLEASIRGALEQKGQASDHRIVNGLRNVFLRRSTPGGNLDVETANIFRGRDHGLPDFDTLRAFHLGKSVYELNGCTEGV